MFKIVENFWSSYQYARLLEAVEKYPPHIKKELGLTHPEAVQRHVRMVLNNR